MMALCHCATIFFFFADKAVSTLCVQIHFTDGATTKPFVKTTRGKCEFVQLVQNKTKQKKKAFSVLFEAFMTYKCFYFYFYLSISYPAYKM